MIDNPPTAKFERFARAMFLDDLPVNPRAFANGLYDYLNAGGEITSDTARAILWTLLSILFGQGADIDLPAELDGGTSAAKSILSNFDTMLLPSKSVSQVWMDKARRLASLAYSTPKLPMTDEWSRLDKVFNP